MLLRHTMKLLLLLNLTLCLTSCVTKRVVIPADYNVVWDKKQNLWLVPDAAMRDILRNLDNQTKKVTTNAPSN